MKFMSRTAKWVSIAVAAAIALGILAWMMTSKSEPIQQSASGVSAEDRALLLKAIQDPFVLHVRSAINNFNAGNTAGISSEIDLGKYRPYLQSKFILMQVNNTATMGGKDMLIAFQDNPDQFFYVWVYQQGDGSLELRAFEPYADISSEQAQQIYAESKPMVEELNLAI